LGFVCGIPHTNPNFIPVLAYCYNSWDALWRVTFDRGLSSGYNHLIILEESGLSEPTHDPEQGEITEDIFNHLVELAAFELEEQEAEYLRRELNGQLKAIRELEAIEIGAEVPITSHGVPYSIAISQPLRQDKIEASKDADDILKQAPEVEDRYIVVPDIPREELE
jgi:aspartyl-tRNA(Asn)/glutamyl-tRNA(Gln) amidotransferase subunit C